MNFSDYLASVALTLSAAALALELRRWFDSKPRLHLSVMDNAVFYPYDDGREKMVLSVTNRGGNDTTIMHFIVFKYKTRLHKIFNRTSLTSIVNSIQTPESMALPSMLRTAEIWRGICHHDESTINMRECGQLYIGIYASHSDKPILKRVRPKKLPTPLPFREGVS
jgi:hypothetical protein